MTDATLLEATLSGAEDEPEVDVTSGVVSLRLERELPAVDKVSSPSILGNL